MSLPAPRGTPYRIGLVCLGNICRSPMAEVVLSQLVDEAGLSRRVEVSSCGTGPWHVGEPIDARAGVQLLAEGYDGSAHRGRQLDSSWVDHDLLLAMDAENLARLRREPGVAGERARMFRSFDPVARQEATGEGPDVPDPYYGGQDGFSEVFAIVERTCRAILSQLQELDL